MSLEFWLLPQPVGAAGVGFPTTMRLANGNFMVAWAGNNVKGFKYAIYDPLGNNVVSGSANTDAAEAQYVYDLIPRAGGGFTLLYGQNTASWQQLHIQHFDAAAQPLGPAITVAPDDFRFFTNLPASFVALPSGGFAVAYTSTSSTDLNDIAVRIVAADGTVGAPIPVNTTTSGRQLDARIATNGTNLFVTWWDEAAGDVRAQMLDLTGAPIGSEFSVPSDATGIAGRPQLEAFANGNYIVVWEVDGGGGADTSSLSARGRLFGPTGSPLGGEFVANDQVAGMQGAPDVTVLPDNTFIVSYFDGSSGFTVGSFRWFEADGTPKSESLDANYFPGNQTSLVTLGDGRIAAFGIDSNLSYLIIDGRMGQLDGDDNDNLLVSTRVGNSTIHGFGGNDRLFGNSDNDTFYGGAGNDELNGAAGNDTLNGDDGNDLLKPGTGSDTANGGADNDGFYFGGNLDASDQVDGGAGSADQLALQGHYGALFTLAAGHLVNVEGLVFLPGNDTRFGDISGSLYSYNLATVDANVAAGQRLTVNFNTLRGGENVTFNGSAESNGSFLTFGGQGIDVLTGGQQGDGFFIGRWGASDSLNGQGGADDQLGLQGLYSGATAVAFGASQLIGVETLVLLSGGDARFGSGGLPYSYTLTMHDGNVAAGQTMIVNANTLLSTETLSFNGAAETNGKFTVFSGAGNDTLIGSLGADTIFGGAGADTMTGGAGADVFAYLSSAHSTETVRDWITDFALGDQINLSAIDANTSLGGNDAFAFIGSAEFSNTAGELRFVSAGGAHWLIRGDTDGNGVADFEMLVTVGDAHPITAADFIL